MIFSTYFQVLSAPIVTGTWLIMDADKIFEQYQSWRRYVGWSDTDRQRIVDAFPCVEPFFGLLVDDFFDEIERHAGARRVLTGGTEQIDRLKRTLTKWLSELFAGDYGRDYIVHRWHIGRRHVTIGLEQAYTNAAMSRLRKLIVRLVSDHFQGDSSSLLATIESLNLLIDLDLMVIQSAYESEHDLRLMRSERLSAIGQVAGGIAHELQNPLHALKTAVYYLIRAPQLSHDKRCEHYQLLDRQINRASSIVKSITDFARLPLPEQRPIDIVQIIRETIDWHSVPENIVISIDDSGNAAFPLGDAEQIRIVFGNLIRNAIEAMPTGGELKFMITSHQDRLKIRVLDTGQGMDGAELAQIMEPLYTTKPRGCGLGLAISRAIVNKHGGLLTVSSELGKGTEFVIELKTANVLQANQT